MIILPRPSDLYLYSYLTEWKIQKLLYMESITSSTNYILYYEPLLKLILQYCLEYRFFINWCMKISGYNTTCNTTCNTTFGVSPDVQVVTSLPEKRQFTMSYCVTHPNKLEIQPTSIRVVRIDIDIRLCSWCKILNKEFYIHTENQFYHPTVGYVNFLNWKHNNGDRTTFDINFEFYKNIFDF